MGVPNVNAGVALSVVSQTEPVADAPVVSTFEIPPLPKPLASDMAKRNF